MLFFFSHLWAKVAHNKKIYNPIALNCPRWKSSLFFPHGEFFSHLSSAINTVFLSLNFFPHSSVEKPKA